MKLKYMCFDSNEDRLDAFYCDAWPAWKKLDLEKASPEKVFRFLESVAADASRNADSEQICYLAADSEGESSDNPRDHMAHGTLKDSILRSVYHLVDNYYYGKDREYVLERIAEIAWKKGGCFFDFLCSKGLIYGCYSADVPGDVSDQEAEEAALSAGVRYICPAFAFNYEECSIRRFRNRRTGRLITRAEIWKKLSRENPGIFPGVKGEYYEKS